MNYYKLIRDGSIFAVATSDDLRKYQQKHNILVLATDANAECVQVGDEFYRDKWMKPVQTAYFEPEEVLIRAVSEEEYTVLTDAMKDGKELDTKAAAQEPAEAVEDEPMDTVVGEDTVDMVRSNKLKELSLACNKAITNGFDLVLDGAEHHFSLTMQDQSNLLAFQVQLLSGVSEFPYHADGEEAVMYSADEIAEVINAASAHKTYHLVYHNALKKWVGSLKRVASIRSVEYGCNIPKKYQTALLKSMNER